MLAYKRSSLAAAKPYSLAPGRKSTFRCKVAPGNRDVSVTMQTNIQPPVARPMLPVCWSARVFFRTEIRRIALPRPLDQPARRSTGERFPRLAFAAGLLLLLLLTGCAAPAVRQQRLVAKPNMTFTDSAVFSYNASRLLPQMATGLAGSSGAQNSGCTSCR